MAPIKMALVGLSKAAATSWAAEGHLPYLLSSRGRSRFQIVALLNSSADSARKAITGYGLNPTTRAYGDPAELAADREVELVVVATRVDTHYQIVRPSLEAGKNAFVEWPLAENQQRAKELLDVVKAKGVTRAIVGLQGRQSPPIVLTKKLIESGVIGKVLSSQVDASSPIFGRGTLPESLAYFADRKIGGNPMTIAFGHLIDSVHFVLGEFSSSHAITQIQRPSITIKKADGSESKIVSDVPDLISVHGSLQGSAHVTDGASLITKFQSSPVFKGKPAFTWFITGEKGELRMTSKHGSFLQSESPVYPMPIEVEDFATGEVTQHAWGWEDWQEPLQPRRGNSIAKVYDLYFEGKDDQLVNFETAVKRHGEVDRNLSESRS